MMSSEKNQTRIRILESTWKKLEDGGGSSIRMSDIAAAAKISRQALYLHFPNRAELLVATTRYLDEINDIDEKLAASRTANTGRERLTAWVEVWGNYIPTIYGVAKALLAIKDSDKDAMIAWSDRMQAVRDGCEKAVEAINADGILHEDLTVAEATDVLWTLQSVRNWEQLRIECGWSQERYLELIQCMAARTILCDE